MLNKRDFLRHPTVQQIMDETAALLEQQTKKLQAIAKRHGMTDEPQLTGPKVGWWKPDPNPWPGKPRVPEMLVRMMLEDPQWVTDFPSCTTRHAAMIDEACKRAARETGHEWKSGDTYSYGSAWTKKLFRWSLQNCKRLLQDAGYKPTAAMNTLSAFVELLGAGRPGEQQAQAESRWYKPYGEHPCEIRFYSGNEFSYSGRTGNVQWRKGSKVCEPINGNATAYFHDAPGKRFALRTFLMRERAIAPEQWWGVKDAAQVAKKRADEAQVLVDVRLKQAQQRRQQVEQRAQENTALDALGIFEAQTPPRNTGNEK
ncbi:hypothetical protein ACQUJS_09125 [Ralstonia pseudosolanacearum]|uniref:Uncharacterized protein n=1 Tax=Ralstonia solanacearum TaxID=305 RepID=A0A0S4TYP0_RALSL|nr:hypothetical protein RSP799_07675 [Ralstonia solanacearum]CUV15148.1 conserved protein of unknown function [Ralstonia solanacearum]